MTGHTATPWTVFDGENPGIDSSGNCSIILYGEEGEGFGVQGRTSKEGQANAKFIVTACNAHEDLVAALDGMVRTFNAPTIDPLVAFAVIENARAALASVER